MSYKIYGLKLIGDSDIKYIGRTMQKLNLRLGNHLSDFRLKTPKVKWCKKNKDNIEIILLEDNIETLEKANEREKYHISKFGIDNLLNVSTGGPGGSGLKHTEKRRLESSNRMKKNNPMKNKEVANRVAQIMKGRKLSEEQKEKISKSGIGKGMKPLIQYDLSGNKIKEFDGPTQVYNELGFDISSIAKCCKGKVKTSYGFIWKYKQLNDIKIEL